MRPMGRGEGRITAQRSAAPLPPDLGQEAHGLLSRPGCLRRTGGSRTCPRAEAFRKGLWCELGPCVGRTCRPPHSAPCRGDSQVLAQPRGDPPQCSPHWAACQAHAAPTGAGEVREEPQEAGRQLWDTRPVPGGAGSAWGEPRPLPKLLSHSQ